MWQLIINGPGYFDTAYELPDGETTLGRADENDVILSGDQVSRRHARLYFENGELFFEDLGSRNGTRLNGGLLDEPHRVSDGEIFTIGENSLMVRQPSDFEVAKTELLAEDDPLRATIMPEQPFGEVLVSRSIEENPFLQDIDLLDNFSVQDFEMLPYLDNFGSGTSPVAVKKPVKAAGKAAGKASRQDAADAKGKTGGREELLLFAKVSEKLNSAASLDAFLNDVVALIVEVAHATTGAALMFDDRGRLSPVVVRNTSGQVPDDVPISRSIVGDVVKKKVAIAVINAQNDANFSNSESVIMYGLEQVICAPMLKGEELLGVIYLNRPAKPSKTMPLPRLVDVVNALAHMLASGVEKWANRAQGQDEGQQRKRLKVFHAPEVVERLRREGALEIGRLDKKRVTALAIDLGDLVLAGEALPAGDVAVLLREIDELFRHLVFEHLGSALRCAGTSALAVFGAPFSNEDDADRALHCAQGLQTEIAALLDRRLPEGHGCAARIALDTSAALAGHMGSADNFDFAILGRCVNTAVRLSAMSKAGALVLTDSVLKASSGQLDICPAELVELKKAHIYKSAVYEIARGASRGQAAVEPMVTKRQRIFQPQSEHDDAVESAHHASASGHAMPPRPKHARSASSRENKPAPASVPEPSHSTASRHALRSIPPLPRVPSRFGSRGPGSGSGQLSEESRAPMRPSLPPLPFAKKAAGSSASTVVASLPDLIQDAAPGTAASNTPRGTPAPRPKAPHGVRAPRPPASSIKRSKPTPEE